MIACLLLSPVASSDPSKRLQGCIQLRGLHQLEPGHIQKTARRSFTTNKKNLQNPIC
jgi:hypothetical protein